MPTSYGFIIELSRNEKLQKNRIILPHTLPPLKGWPTWIINFYKWVRILIVLAGDGECQMARFHTTRNFLTNEIYQFSRLSRQMGCFFYFYLRSLLHKISCLFHNKVLHKIIGADYMKKN